MNKSLTFVSLVVALALSTNAKAELEETEVKTVARVVRPTVVCSAFWEALNSELKKLQERSYQVSHFDMSVSGTISEYCIVVEPKK